MEGQWGGVRTKLTHRFYFILLFPLLVLCSIWYTGTTTHVYYKIIKCRSIACENLFLHTKAAAWAKPSWSQAVNGSFGLA